MAGNPVAQGAGTLVNTASTLTFGAGPGQVAPPQLLMQNLSAGGTVTLPKINPVFPTAPGTPGETPGIGDGFVLSIKSLTAFPTTIAAASGDTTEVALLTQVNYCETLVADAPNSIWRRVLSQTGTTIRTVAGAATLAATDRFLIITTAASVTTAANATFQPGTLYSIINTSVGSVTVTPASGNIEGAAAVTLATNTSMSIFCGGTDWFRV